MKSKTSDEINHRSPSKGDMLPELAQIQGIEGANRNPTR